MSNLISITALFFAAAQIAQASCHVPDQLDRRIFTNVADQAYSPQNPNAGSIFNLRFARDTYALDILNTGESTSGTYTYQRLANNVGQMTATEDFGGQTTQYTLTLICLTPRTGTFVYSQERGAIKPDVRQNTGRYTLQD